MEGYTIGELTKKLNINKETIRYYEKIGLLAYPKRSGNGYRVYTEDDIELVQFILIIKKLGFTLKEIKSLIDEEILYGKIKDVKKLTIDKIAEIDLKIRDLEIKKELMNKVNKAISDDPGNCKSVKEILENKS